GLHFAHGPRVAVRRQEYAAGIGRTSALAGRRAGRAVRSADRCRRPEAGTRPGCRRRGGELRVLLPDEPVRRVPGAGPRRWRTDRVPVRPRGSARPATRRRRTRSDRRRIHTVHRRREFRSHPPPARVSTYDDRTALVVVDVQNDFADPNGSLYVARGEEVPAAANAEVAAAREAGAFVVYSQDWHPEQTPHFANQGGVW